MVEQINDQVIEIAEVGKFLLVQPKTLLLPEDVLVDDAIFNSDFAIELSTKENEQADHVDFLLFQFGNKFYYTNDLVPDEIKEFKYLGKPNLAFAADYTKHLGVHGGFELCNGSREYKDWIKKAKFFGINTLGICELNTLAGTLSFQEACIEEDIKPIIGETITILTDTGGKMHVKVYVCIDAGWESLLRINKIINVDHGGEYITELELLREKWDGLFCVLTPDVIIEKYKHYFEKAFVFVYYQLDFVEWGSQSKDEQWLTAIKEYFTNWIKKLPPILICDSYYLDQADHGIQKSLNTVGDIGFRNQSKDQYFKSIDDIYQQIVPLFPEGSNVLGGVLNNSIENLDTLCDAIDFKIPVGHFRLPEYEMDEYQQQQCNTNEDLFFALIHRGLLQKGIDTPMYMERLEEEVGVISEGGFIDYFLILWDILQWCESQGIWYGIGRGSAAGSLVSYLLGIVGIDPIKYKLLFSRFLNKGRLGKSLPDIDLDFQGERRDEVLNYIKRKYGNEYVTVIGTYSTFKIKGALKDLCREKGTDYKKTNFYVSLLEVEGTFTDLFKVACKKEDFKEFIQKNHTVIEKIPLCLNQAKNASIHASGVVIVPKGLGTVFQQMPIKKLNDVLVSEWEGEYIDKAGFLKFDVLGVKQLDKIAAVAKLIKENTGDVIKFDDIPLDEPDVYKYFQEGWNEDVFQFGTPGLKAYCKELKPDNIEDLIAAVSLYRPGPMESGAHKKYVRVKNGSEKVSYDPGTEEITKETYGQIVYQEQIMQVCTHIAGFDSVEADDIRKAMGKKDQELLDSMKDKFIQGAIKKGYDAGYLVELWDKMESFARYAFNRSHAAAYAITGYFCQWLKYTYPIEFWTISMQYADEADIINCISEINKMSGIDVSPVDINNSITKFYADKAKNTIYWSINSVKYVGPKAVEAILAERERGGEFFSIEEFCDRVKSEAIDKRIVCNLILAGAFDKVEKIKPHQRGALLDKYYTFSNKKPSDELLLVSKWRDYQWVLKQKELTGYGFMDYSKFVKASRTFATHQRTFRENGEVLTSDAEKEEFVVVAGILQNVIERKSKKGVFGQLEIIDNTDRLFITLWNEAYEPVRAELKEAKDKIVMVSGYIEFDNYKQTNSIRSSRSTQLEIV